MIFECATTNERILFDKTLTNQEVPSPHLALSTFINWSKQNRTGSCYLAVYKQVICETMVVYCFTWCFEFTHSLCLVEIQTTMVQLGGSFWVWSQLLQNETSMIKSKHATCPAKGGRMIIRIDGTQITQIERIYADFFCQRLSEKSAS